MNEILDGSPYRAYLYSYPHKTSYRAFDPPIELGQLWSQVDKRSLFLYLHVPFCEMRCGFCNLFTSANPKGDVVAAYLEAIERQARRDSVQTQAAALRYVDAHLPALFAALQRRAPVLAVLCSDHGTSYGEDGYTGHRHNHVTVGEVPYAELVLPRLRAHP